MWKKYKIYKNKSNIKGTIVTCLEDFTGGLLLIRVDENQYLYNEVEELLTDIKYITAISEVQWKKIYEENNAIKMNEKSKKNKARQSKYRKKKLIYLITYFYNL